MISKTIYVNHPKPNVEQLKTSKQYQYEWSICK